MSDGSKKRDRSRKECRREDIRGSGRNLIDGNGIQSDNSQKEKGGGRGETYIPCIHTSTHTHIHIYTCTSSNQNAPRHTHMQAIKHYR